MLFNCLNGEESQGENLGRNRRGRGREVDDDAVTVGADRWAPGVIERGEGSGLWAAGGDDAGPCRREGGDGPRLVGSASWPFFFFLFLFLIFCFQKSK